MDFLLVSFYAAILVIVITVIRAAALYRLPKSTFVALWGIAALRLSIPVQIKSSLNIYALMGKLFGFKTGIASIRSGTEYFAQAVAGGESSLHRDFSALRLIWLIGICFFAAYFIIGYFRARGAIMKSEPFGTEYLPQWVKVHRRKKTVQIRLSEKNTIPMTCGIFRPVIILPKQICLTDKKELDYILAHELTHIDHFDLVFKLCLTVLVCLHWFNPFVWLMYKIANRDIELRCDEKVVKKFGIDMKSSYALALIEFEEKKALFPLVNYFSHNAAEERIKAIMKIKRYPMPVIIAAVLTVITVTVGFSTSPMLKDQGREIVQAQNFVDGDGIKRNDTERVRSSVVPERETEENGYGTGEENSVPGVYFAKAEDAIIGKRIFGDRVIDDPRAFAEREFGNTIFYDDPGRSE